MDVLESNQQHKILFKDLNRENLYNLFKDNNPTHISISEIDKLSQNNKGNEPKYRTEKLLLLYLMMDSNLDKKIIKDNFYMSGFLLYITNNPLFKYNLGYFIDYRESFNEILNTWSKFLDSIISEIKTLPKINLPQQITIEYEEVLNITILEEFIIKVEIAIENFDKLFKLRNKTYDFTIKINNVIIHTDINDINKKTNNLHKAFTELNRLIASLSINNQQLISLIHGN